MRAVVRYLPRTIRFGLVLDLRGSGAAGARGALRSLSEQVYEHWTARVLVDGRLPAALRAELEEIAAADPRTAIVEPGADWLGDADFVGALDRHDRLERHALFECAVRLQADDVDVIYTDEDRVDRRGVPGRPWFKPDWSPETLLTRDYVGRLCLLRRALVDAVGGVRDVLGSAKWYDALLRVTESTDRVAHVAQVLYHRSARNAVDPADLALAVEVALRRRGEEAQIVPTAHGLDVRYAVPGDERVCIVMPTRDRADLLGPCLDSIFERIDLPRVRGAGGRQRQPRAGHRRAVGALGGARAAALARPARPRAVQLPAAQQRGRASRRRRVRGAAQQRHRGAGAGLDRGHAGPGAARSRSARSARCCSTPTTPCSTPACCWASSAWPVTRTASRRRARPATMAGWRWTRITWPSPGPA